MKIRTFAIAMMLFFAQSVLAQTSASSPAIVQEDAQDAAKQKTQLGEADALSQRIIKLYDEGKYKEAVPLAQHVIEIRARILPDTDPLLVSAWANLAELFIALKKFDEAEPLYLRVLAVHETLKPDKQKLGDALDRLALISFGRGNSSRAENFYKRALAAREQAYGQNHPQFSQSLYALAEFYRFRFEFSKAEPLYRRALAIEDESPALQQSGDRRALDGLTCLLYESEQSDKIKKLYEERRARSGTSGNSKLLAGGILNGKAIGLPKPAYPPSALSARISGTVVVKVMIDESGKVIQAEDLCGATRPLANASIEAALRARFSPTLLSGQPVKVSGTIVYKFVSR